MIQKAILATLAYYDVLDLPLTKLELWHYLINPVRVRARAQRAPEELEWTDSNGINPERWNQSTKEFQLLRDGAIIEILAELGKMVEEKKIEQASGFYCLPGRSGLVAERFARQKLAEAKWKIAKRYLWLAQGLPYIRALLASGSLGLGFMEAESDLDILTITAPGRIWLARLFLTGLMGLLGRRRKKGQASAPDKLCLNHYITETSLAIPWQSLYNAQTYAHLWPMYLKDKVLVGRFNDANSWIREYVINWPKVEVSRQWLIKPSWLLQALGADAERLLELTHLGPALNRLAKKIQLRRLAADRPSAEIALPLLRPTSLVPLPLSCASRGRITATDQQLEFHPHSPETVVLDKYNQIIKQLGQFGDYQEKDSGLN